MLIKRGTFGERKREKEREGERKEISSTKKRHLRLTQGILEICKCKSNRQL